MGTYEQPREQEQIVGTISGIVQKGVDKWQVEVMPDGGGQYSKKLWTKDQSIVASASTLIGQRMAFLCNVSHWTNNQNQPIRSLWIEAFGPSAVGSPALAGPPMSNWEAAQAAQAAAAQPPMAGMQGWPSQPPSGPPMVPVTPTVIQGTPTHFNDDPKQAKIHRQTASKVAAIMLSHVAPEERTMSTLFVLAERLVAYYDNGLPNPETLDDLMQRAMPADMGGPDPAAGTGYADTPPEDDIPF